MKIKRAARTVVFDDNNLVALIKVRGGEYYKIPGGGTEGGETEEEAAKRETMEEAGCEIDILQKIGDHEFEDRDSGLIHQSVCFLAKKIGDTVNTNFDEWEKSNGMESIWVSFPEAVKLFSGVTTTDFFGSQINKRDFDFVLKAKEILDNST